MAARGGEDAAEKRRNRTVSLGEAIGGLLDPALKRRGFASRDLIVHWQAMAPAPYNRVARPEKLSWPRGKRGAEGAVLHLACHPGHRLALQHEGQQVAAAVNRYFGYVLVGSVRISPMPLDEEATDAAPPQQPSLPEATRMKISRRVSGIGDPDLRQALHALGRAIAGRR